MRPLTFSLLCNATTTLFNTSFPLSTMSKPDTTHKKTPKSPSKHKKSNDSNLHHDPDATATDILNSSFLSQDPHDLNTSVPSSAASFENKTIKTDSSSSSNSSVDSSKSLGITLPTSDSIEEVYKFVNQALPKLDKAGYKARNNLTLTKLVDQSYKSEVAKFNKSVIKILEKSSNIYDILSATHIGTNQAQKLQCMQMESAALKGRHVKTSADMDFLIENLLLQSQNRTGWAESFIIKSYQNGSLVSTKDLIEDHATITESMILNHNFLSSDSVKLANTTMYNCLMQTCHQSLIDKVSIHKNKYGTIGPKFLFYILQALREGNKEIRDDAEDYSKEFCTKANHDHTAFENMIGTMVKKLQKLKATNTSGTTVIEIVTTALQSVNHHAFQHKLNGSLNKITKPTIDTTISLLQEASKYIDALKKLGSWSKDSGKANPDLAALNASKLKRAPSARSGDRNNKRRKGNPVKELLPFSEYAAHKHIGPEKHYSTKQQFTTFVSGRWGKDSVEMNGIDWHWCANCKRMGSHKTPLHDKAFKDFPSKPKKKSPPKPDDTTLLANNAELDFEEYPDLCDDADTDLTMAESFDADDASSVPQE